MPMIRVDSEIYELLNEKGRTEDTFNDVLRRELGLPSRKSGRQSQAHLSPTTPPVGHAAARGANSELESVLHRRLPPHWADTPARKIQIVEVVQKFLQTPGNWDTKDRHLYAVKAVAAERNLTIQTVADKCGRQLYGEGELQPRFRRALDAIEMDLRDQPK